MTDSDKTDGGGLGRRLRIVGWGAAAGLLLLPLIAMRFSDEVRWTAFDFAFAGGFFLLVGGALEVTARLSRDWVYGAAVGLALAAAFLLVWTSGAVGIIGPEDEPANALYLAVIAVAAIGAALAWLRASGMAYAMSAAAALQTGIGAAAVILSWGAADPSWPVDILGATAVLTGLWLASAWLLRRAARRAAAALTV